MSTGGIATGGTSAPDTTAPPAGAEPDAGGDEAMDYGVSPEELDTLDLTEFTEEEVTTLRGGKERADDAPDPTKGAKPPVERQSLKKAAPPPDGFVPITALHEQREENKALKKAIAEHQQTVQQIAQKLAERRAEAEPKKEAEPEDDTPPDPMKDPVGATIWAQKKLTELANREAAQKKEHEERTAEAERGQQRYNFVVTKADEVLKAATEANPQVLEAFSFAAKAIRADLTRRGLQGEALERAYKAKVFQYAHDAPVDPSEMANYAFYHARGWGWNPNAKPAAEKPSNADRLKRLETSVQRNKTLSGGGTADGQNELNLDDLAAMSGEELEKFAGDNPEIFQKLTGIK